MNVGIKLNTTVLKEILEARRSRYMTNKIRAAMIGVSPFAFYKWLSGETSPSVKHFKALVKALNMTRNEVRYLVPSYRSVLKKRGLMEWYKSLYYVPRNSEFGLILHLTLRSVSKNVN